MSESATNARVCSLDERVQPKLKILRNTLEKIALHSAFLEATIEYAHTEKIEKSFSGHIVDAQKIASAHVCIMALCRFWDKQLPLKIVEMIRPLAKDIESIRRSENPNWSPESLQIGTLLEEILKTGQIASHFLKSNRYAHIRTFRTEILAHNETEPSRDRRKFLGVEVEPKTKYWELIEASKVTFEVFDRLISHWEFHIEDTQSLFNIYKTYSLMYWDALPKFGEVEDESILDSLFSEKDLPR